ncbi:MAG: DUF4238 domain-containing protein [Nitrospirota bacterium]|nr:DUF4238 domain-containing protein [Nitrospirota bacterium]
MSGPVQHHYLPKSAYLRFVEPEEKPDFIYLSQRDQEIVLVNTRKIAKERHLYSFTNQNGLLDSSVEQMLGDFEQRATPVLGKFNYCEYLQPMWPSIITKMATHYHLIWPLIHHVLEQSEPGLGAAD